MLPVDGIPRMYENEESALLVLNLGSINTEPILFCISCRYRLWMRDCHPQEFWLGVSETAEFIATHFKVTRITAEAL